MGDKTKIKDDVLSEAIGKVNAATLVQQTGSYEKAFLLITDSLTAALKGDTLRGLPNLGTHASPFFGLNLRGPALDFKISFPSSSNDDVGPLQLVLHESGTPFWVFAIRSVVKRNWFDFGREAVIAGDAGLQPRGVDGKVCPAVERANVITAADLQRLMTCLPSFIETHLQVVKEEQALTSDAEVFAKRVADKLRGNGGGK